MSPAMQEHGWRRSILEHFTADNAAAGRVTVALDPDGLLTEPGLLAAIQEQGFALVVYGDPILFRYDYESRFRAAWERDQGSHLVVVLQDPTTGPREVPFDVLAQAEPSGRVLTFGLAELFPTLAPNVVAALDVGSLDALSAVLHRSEGERLGENATKDFLLRHVFELAPELLQTPADLLRALLRKHYRAGAIPTALDDRVLVVLSRAPTWSGWPMEAIVRRREDFLSFLQERWGRFLRDRSIPLRPGCELPSLRWPGPELLPFDHDEVRVYMDNLFADGLLRPSADFEPTMVEGSWWRVGVQGNSVDDVLLRLERLLPEVERALPAAEANHLTWLAFAPRWAEVLALRFGMTHDLAQHLLVQLEALHAEIELRFGTWMHARFGGLSSLPHLPAPRTLDKVGRYLAHHRNQLGAGGRVALVVVDGLALDQWVVLRDSLGGLRCEEGATFAWVPTLTTVSRQAIFAGEVPFHFADHLHTTSREATHWTRFWDDQGLRGGAVAYRGQGHDDDDTFRAEVGELVKQGQCKALGLMVTTVDRLLHGAVTGSSGLHASVQHWGQTGSLRQLLDMLLGAGFDVFVTSDHGNLEARGLGKPNVGAVATERGERVHVFRDDLTRQRVQETYAGAVSWPGAGLPADYRVLLAPGRKAFVQAGTLMVGHGGISLEEVVVPWIRVVSK